MKLVNRELFEDWKMHPVTVKLLNQMHEDRENMKENIVMGSYDNEEEIKGRCMALYLLLNLSFEDLFHTPKED